MVAKYGMSEVLGPAVFSDENDEVFLGKDFGHVNNYAELPLPRLTQRLSE